MAATMHLHPSPPLPAIDDELVGYVSTGPHARRYRRRRCWAGLAVLGLAAVPVWGAVRGAAALGGDPASVPERRPAPALHVVQPGETLWSIARSLQPEGDVRSLVRQLRDANGGAELDIGDRLVVPG